MGRVPEREVRSRPGDSAGACGVGSGNGLVAELFLGHRPPLDRVVAGRLVVALEGAKHRRLDVAMAGLEAWAARMEHARGRRRYRRGDVAGEHDPLTPPGDAVRLRPRDGREQ